MYKQNMVGRDGSGWGCIAPWWWNNPTTDIQWPTWPLYHMNIGYYHTPTETLCNEELVSTYILQSTDFTLRAETQRTCLINPWGWQQMCIYVYITVSLYCFVMYIFCWWHENKPLLLLPTGIHVHLVHSCRAELILENIKYIFNFYHSRFFLRIQTTDADAMTMHRASASAAMVLT